MRLKNSSDQDVPARAFYGEGPSSNEFDTIVSGIAQRNSLCCPGSCGIQEHCGQRALDCGGKPQSEDTPMQRSFLMIAAAVTFCFSANGAQALPMIPGAIRAASDDSNILERVAVYVVEGSRYCFY